MDVIGSIGSVIDLVRKAKELADKLKNLEMKEMIVDLQSKLIDLKEQIATIREENIQLKADAQKLALPPELVVKDGVYYKPENWDGPFCTGCFDSQGKLMRLAMNDQDTVLVMGTKWRCPVCRTSFTGR